MKKTTERVPAPKIHDSAYIAAGAKIYGDVEIGEGASVWFNAVIRGDEGRIHIGKNTNIQDNAVIHSDDGAAVNIGESVTIGHGAVIRGCRIGHHVMIGMNATLMSGSIVGDYSIVGANALVAYGKVFPKYALIMGLPAKFVRQLRADELDAGTKATEIYAGLVKAYGDGTIARFVNEC